MNTTCKERIGKELKSEMETIRALWTLYQSDSEASHEEYGHIYEHGLSFDYVAPGTFRGQRRGYFRPARDHGRNGRGSTRVDQP